MTPQMLQCKNQTLNKDLLDLTSAIFFFGTPHQGLRTTELEAMVNDMLTKLESVASMLLLQLREDSEFTGFWSGNASATNRVFFGGHYC